MVSPVDCRFVEQRAAVTGLTVFEIPFLAGSRDNIRFSILPKRVRSSTMCIMTWIHVKASGHAFQVWSLPFLVSR